MSLTPDQQIAAWQTVERALDTALPEWRESTAELGDCARIAVVKLAYAANIEELSLIQTHLKNEMAVVRHILALPGLPETAEKELRAHLMRMARLV